MSRSQTTGAYTRVSNSFSEPVVGTTISPSDADTFFDDVEACMNSFLGTSTTSLAIQLGSRTFTIASDVANKVFLANTQIHAFSLSNTANYMDCTVTSYNNGTGALVTNCFNTGGSGTITDWVIISAGARGGAGQGGFSYTYNTGTSGDPGTGQFLFNNATFASATAMNISETDADGNGLAAILATLDDSTSTTKCLVVFSKVGGAGIFVGYITGTITDNGTYDTFSLTPVTSSGSLSNGDAFRAQFFRVGDKGTDGSIAGSTGSTDNRVLRADGTGGATLQNSAVTIDDSGNVTGVAALTTSGNIELGNVSDTTVARSAAGQVSVEGINLGPAITITSKSAAYTTVMADGNTTIYHPSSDNNARTFTIDSNANVAYPVGTTLTFINEINTVTISITSDTLVLAGAGSTGSRTLAANGVATAIKVTTTRWYISGSGIT